MRLSKEELSKFPQYTKLVTTKKHEYYKQSNGWVDEYHRGITNKTMARKEIEKVYVPKTEYVEWQRTNEVLDDVEKMYLSNIIRPFRERVKGIERIQAADYSQIWIHFYQDETIMLPSFTTDTMYKNMKPDILYPVSILGGLEDDNSID